MKTKRYRDPPPYLMCTASLARLDTGKKPRTDAADGADVPAGDTERRGNSAP